MKLDSRIYEGKKPLTPLDDEKAKQFIGEKGYFANALQPFTDLIYATKGTVATSLIGLRNVSDNEIFVAATIEDWTDVTPTAVPIYE